MAKGIFSGLFRKDDGAEAAAANTGGVPSGNAGAVVKPVMSDDLRNRISFLKGQQPGPDLTPVDVVARMFPISAEIAREEAVKEAARKKAETEALKNPQPGQLITGKGVFIGVWMPKDRDGKSLNKTFNLFAAPYDLGLDENGKGSKLVIKYNDAVKAVAKIKNLMGHDGANFATDAPLYEALKKGTYKGEWFIPTREMVNGTDLDGNKVQNDNLYQHRNTGEFANSFTTASGSGTAHWYWSCTEHREFPSSVYGVGFTDGGDGWLRKDLNSLSARVVRAELRP